MAKVLESGNMFESKQWPAGLGILACSISMALAQPEWAKAIRYSPPPNFEAFKLRNDPGDNPFSGNGPGFMLLGTDQKSQINFQIGLIGWSIGNGKRITYYKIGPQELNEELSAGDGELRLTGTPRPKGMGLTGVRNTTISGLSAALWSGELPMAPGPPFKTVWVERCWIQIQTNLALKITATAHDQKAFVTLTDSLTSLSIDVKELLKGLQPKEPKVIETRLDTIELGYMRYRGQRTAAGIVRAKGHTQSFAIAEGFGGPERTLAEVRAIVEGYNQKRSQAGALRLALLSHSRVGDGPKDFQHNFWLINETNQNTIARFRGNEFQMEAPQLMMWECWTNREPEQFEKVAAYALGVKLLIRTDD